MSTLRSAKLLLRRRLHLEVLEDRTVPAVIDLTVAEASAAVNGVVMVQADPQPTGVGVIHDFLRVQSNNGVEHGYNSDARPVQLDEKKDHHTRAVKLSELPAVTAGGFTYRVILLGVNQNQSQPLISLDELRIYVADGAKLAGYNAATKQLGGQTARFDLGDNWIKLDSSLTNGNGSGDMFLYVPENLLTSTTSNDPYIYIYSKFGLNHAANGGFEQWAPGEGVTLPASASVSGVVYRDIQRDGVFNGQDPGIREVTVTLTGTDSFGQQITMTTLTKDDGSYTFGGLMPGTYRVVETQPLGFEQGITTVGTVNGTENGLLLGNDDIGEIQLHPGQFGINYNFGEFLDDAPS
jgi:hypothetical protein